MVANLERRLVLPRKQERDAREMSAVGTALQPQQRRSAFPPLLGRSGEEREAGAARGSRTVPHKPAAKERKTQVKTKRPRKATAITGDFVRNERDDEIQRRQKKVPKISMCFMIIVNNFNNNFVFYREQRPL